MGEEEGGLNEVLDSMGGSVVGKEAVGMSYCKLWVGGWEKGGSNEVLYVGGLGGWVGGWVGLFYLRH